MLTEFEARDEPDGFAKALTEHFAADGIRFFAPRPDRWYARLAAPRRLITASLSEARGRNIARFQPRGEDALWLKKLANEAQMVLHAHPDNAAREERNEPTVNSVWFWGGGARPDVTSKPFEAVWADNPLAQGLAAAAGLPTMPLPESGAGWLDADPAEGDHLVVLDDLSHDAAYGDIEGWRNTLEMLERKWFVPLYAALKSARLSRLAIHAIQENGSTVFNVTRLGLWKAWRRARKLDAYAP